MSFSNHNGSSAPAARQGGARKHNKHEDEEAGKVFVGGLSWETTQENLLNYFSRFGEVIDCVVMKNAETGRSRGFGFVTFSDPANIEAVISACPHTLDGRTIDPKPCNPRSMQKPKKTTVFPKVFLGGLPSSITETDLRAFFSRYGEVVEVVIMYDQEKKKARGFGFLSFTTEDVVDRVVAEHYVNIQNKQVEIKRAEPRTTTETVQHNQTTLTNGLAPTAGAAGPVVDQWASAATTNGGVHVTAVGGSVAPTAFSGWGTPAAAAVESINLPQTAPTAYWGSPPPAVTQPSPQGWGAPPPHPPVATATIHQPPAAAAAYPSLQQQHQPTLYNNHHHHPTHHFISPAAPSAAAAGAPPPTFTASFWGSPPGPTPPPTTPQEMYSPHAVSPQSPPQPKFDISVPGTTFHVHAAPPPHTDYTRIYHKAGAGVAPTQFTSAPAPNHDFYTTSPAVTVGFPPPAATDHLAQRIGGIPAGFAPAPPPPQQNNIYAFRRT